MKFITLVLQNYREDIKKNSFIIIQFILFFYIFLFSLGTNNEYKSITNITESNYFDNKYYVSIKGKLFDKIFRQQNFREYDKLIKDIEKNDSNVNIQTIRYFSVNVNEFQNTIPLRIIDDELLRNTLGENKQTMLPNEVLVSSDLKSHFRVNDVITTSLRDLYGARHEVDLRIVGFIQENTVLPDFKSSGSYVDFGNIFHKDNFYMLGSIVTSNNEEIYGIPDPGMLINSDSYGNNDYLGSQHQENINITSFRYIEKSAGEKISTRVSEMNFMLFSILVLGFAGLQGNLLIEIISKKREYSVYYLNGLSHRKCIVFASLKNIMNLIFAWIIACLILEYQIKNIEYLNIFLTLQMMIITFVIAILVYLVSVSVAFMQFKNESIIYSIRSS